MRRFCVVIVATLGCCAAAMAAGNGWSRLRTPLPGMAEAIGFYSAGCLRGAVTLPLKGEGFQVMRPSRNRFYGHPRLIDYLHRLARQTAARGGRLLIGDLAQPRGGPMAYGHRSHQIGLDADIWFYQEPTGRELSRQETEKIPMQSMVIASVGRLHPTRWSPLYRDVLKMAATAPEVARIFVNPVIKQALCRSERDRTWLRKIRPWWGHDAHFHVRLRCPPESSRCQAQTPPPPGDGCGEDLDNWVRELQQAAIKPPQKTNKPARKPIELPALCHTVLNGG